MSPSPPPPSSDPTPSPSALLHLLTLKHLSDAGFASTSRAASHTLASLVERYLLSLAQGAARRAEHSGRRRAGALDVVQELEAKEGRGALGELEEWVGREERGRWGGEGYERGVRALGEQLSSGLGIDKAMASMRVTSTEQIELELVNEEGLGASDEDEEDDGAERDGMDVDGPIDVKPQLGALDHVDIDMDNKPTVSSQPYADTFRIRPGSPDMSWLPPLPGSTSVNASDTPPQRMTDLPSLPTSSLLEATATTSIPATASASASGTTIPPPKPSLLHKYLHPIPFAQSELASSDLILPSSSSHPPSTSTSAPPPPRESTLPALMAAYEALKREGAITLPVTPLRKHALDLLVHTVAPADFYAPDDTLSFPLPGPKPTLAMPSYSRPLPDGSPALAVPGIPINPNPTGPLGRLLREMHSPYLPPALKHELTHLLPPPPQMQPAPGGEGQGVVPLLYNEPVRGPDEGMLLAAKGRSSAAVAAAQAAGEGKVDKAEEYYRFTFDAGPRGQERWGKKLVLGQGGKKVVQSGQGEEAPRRVKQPGLGEGPGAGMGASGSGVSAGMQGAPGVPEGQASVHAQAPMSTPTPTPTQSGPVRLRLDRRLSTTAAVASGAEAGSGGMDVDNPSSGWTSAAHGMGAQEAQANPLSPTALPSGHLPSARPVSATTVETSPTATTATPTTTTTVPRVSLSVPKLRLSTSASPTPAPAPAPAPGPSPTPTPTTAAATAPSPSERVAGAPAGTSPLPFSHSAPASAPSPVPSTPSTGGIKFKLGGGGVKRAAPGDASGSGTGPGPGPGSGVSDLPGGPGLSGGPPPPSAQERSGEEPPRRPSFKIRISNSGGGGGGGAGGGAGV